MTIVVTCAAFFAMGLYGVLTRRDIVGVLASIEIMLSGALVLLIALASTAPLADGSTAQPGTVTSIGLIVLVVAAAEAAVGLSLLVAVARSMRTTRIDDLTEVRG